MQVYQHEQQVYQHKSMLCPEQLASYRMRCKQQHQDKKDMLLFLLRLQHRLLIITISIDLINRVRACIACVAHCETLRSILCEQPPRSSVGGHTNKAGECLSSVNAFSCRGRFTCGNCTLKRNSVNRALTSCAIPSPTSRDEPGPYTPHENLRVHPILVQQNSNVIMAHSVAKPV